MGLESVSIDNMLQEHEKIDKHDRELEKRGQKHRS